MFWRFYTVVVGFLMLGFAAITLTSSWSPAAASAFAVVGAWEIYSGMRRPPELTWSERRRWRRNRQWIARRNAENQERELRAMLGETPPPVQPTRRRRSGAGTVMLALVGAVTAGILVIAAIHGFRPSGS